MKSTLKIMALLAVLSFAQQASAATIRLTGSTAFRSGVHKSIVALMGGAANCKFAHGKINLAATTADQSGYEGADYTTIQGTLSGIGGISTVYCHWTGSATGISDVASGASISFIPTSKLPVSNGYANAAVTQTATENAVAQIAFSDVFQSSTTITSPALTDTVVAIIPFSWVANRLTTGIDNITAQQARALLTLGLQPKSLLTGNPADTDYVLQIGRDNGSGTRGTMLAETKYGVFTPVKQWKFVTSGSTGSGTVTSGQVWTIGDGEGSDLAGNGGYSSGSFIRTILGMSATSGVELFDENNNSLGSGLSLTLVSCLGVSDADTAVTNGGVRLKYDGVLYDGSNPNLIYNGQYTMWGYLHLYTNGAATGDLLTFKNGVDTQLDNPAVLGTSGLRDSQMQVFRQFDGAIVGP
ncbi:hypothetical protein [Prosthecobacter sp.]|uniref:hypothetical protein n=1 Tax=Prosthecobacter sp. TaxID=1965333 RepID=UPI002487D0CE|nr:hypothetical protein [Prosthecobacter sp.]MDI1314391.1 hypothetical protein [Prosthecobacter sp.]